MNNVFKSTILEFHIIQTFPVSCLNRDKVGSPKTALIGGVERARVSSQAWKRSIRSSMRDLGVTLGVRTGKINLLLADKIQALGASEEASVNCANEISAYITKDTLVFLSDKELNALAMFACENGFEFQNAKTDDSSKSKKKVKAEPKVDIEKSVAKILKEVSGSGLDAVDIALFGRMIAKISDINIDAALSVSHAISTHRGSIEVDSFTAIDDFINSGASSYLGENLFNSATYYRYLSLNLGQLAETIFGDTPVNVAQMQDIIGAFVKALYIAVPKARQSVQAAYSPWDFSQVLIRKGQPLQVSFDKPVVAERDTGFSKPSVDRLKSEINTREKLSGSLFGLVKKIEFGEDENYSIDHLVADINGAVEVLHGQT